MNNHKASDYVVLWCAGAGIAYVLGSGMALISCLEHFSGLQTSVLYGSNSVFGSEFALAAIALLLSIVVCVLNIVYAQTYFRNHDGKRSRLGMVATVSFIVLVGFQLCRTISSIASYFNANRVYGSDGIVMLLDVVIWGLVIFDAINAIMGTLAFWFIFKKVDEVADDIYVRVDGTVQESGIAAEVADHAMGRPKPSYKDIEEVKAKDTAELSQDMHDPIDSPYVKPTEEEEKKKEEEKKEKELPPVLSANPDNEMLGKINREERVLKMDVPTFASPDEARKSHEHEKKNEEEHHEPVHHTEENFEEDTLPVDKSMD